MLPSALIKRRSKKVIAPMELQTSLSFYEVTKELPKDVLLLIFGQLSEQDLARARMVCRRWNVVGQDERVASKFAFALGARVWYEHFGSVGVEPPLPATINELLKTPCPFWSGKRVQETHMLVLIPATVNGKALTLDSLEELIQKPKKGHATRYSYYWDALQKEFGKQSPLSFYWVLMTKDVVEGTRNKSYGDQCALVAEYSAYGVPTLLEAAAGVLMHHVKNGERLYSDSPWTYTRCQEKVAGVGFQCVVGGFAGAGLHFSDCSGSYVGDFVGLAVARKFPRASAIGPLAIGVGP